MMTPENYYYHLTDTPALGMIYWDNGRYLHPCYYHPPYMPASVQKALKQYILRIERSYTISADTDGGCDRSCECEEYRPLLPQNIITDDGNPIGVYLDLGYDYRISPMRPNVIVIPFEEGGTYYHADSETTYTLVPFDPEKHYQDSSAIR